MSEKPETHGFSDIRTEKSTEGHWVLHEGKPMWQEVTITRTYDTVLGIWNKKESEPVYKSPSEVGLVKDFTLTILFREEFENRKKHKQVEIAWFLERKKILVREDRTHVWLLWSDNKLWIKDVWNQQTFPCPLKESTPDIIITDLDDEPRYLSQTDLKETLKTSDPKMIFSKKDDDSNYGIELKVKQP